MSQLPPIPPIFKAIMAKFASATKGIGNSMVPALGAIGIIGGGSYALYNSVVTSKNIKTLKNTRNLIT